MTEAFYTCEQCGDRCGQLNLDRENKVWKCNKCFYEKNHKQSTRGAKER